MEFPLAAVFHLGFYLLGEVLLHCPCHGKHDVGGSLGMGGDLDHLVLVEGGMSEETPLYIC